MYPSSCHLFFYVSVHHRDLHSFPTRRSSDLERHLRGRGHLGRWHRRSPPRARGLQPGHRRRSAAYAGGQAVAHEHVRSEEHTSELQSRVDLVCRLLLEKKKKQENKIIRSEYY